MNAPTDNRPAMDPDNGENSANAAVSGTRSNQFCVGEWLIDPKTNRLIRDDQDTKVESRVMEVLVYLADRSGELVSREELERGVWKNRVVSYESVTSTINKLRKAFNDNPKAPNYIETVPKKGYRLIAQIRPQDSAESADQKELFTSGPTSNTNKTVIYIIILAAALIAVILLMKSWLSSQQGTEFVSDSLEIQHVDDNPSIVVLPFKNLSSDKSQQYLGDGFSDDLTIALSKLSGLFVIARSSAVNFTTDSEDAKQIAGKLGVDYVLEGSVRREGQKLRVNVKLIDGRSGHHVWADQYDREIKDIFDVQDEINNKIVGTLSVKLTEAEQKRTAQRYTTSINAYEKFLQGQQLYMYHTREDNIRARESFQYSIDLDSDFSRAYSAMALTYTAEFRYGWNQNSQESITKALGLAKKAIELDPQSPQAYWVEGYIYLQRREYKLAIASAKRATELSPNFADGYATLGVCYIYAGSPEKGVRMLERAMRLNPQYPAAYASALGQSYYFMDQFDQALPPLRKAVEKNNNLLTSQVFLIATLVRLGQVEEAKWAAIQLKSINPGFSSDKVGEMFPINDSEKLQKVIDDLRQADL